MKYLRPVMLSGLALLLASLTAACSDDDSTSDVSPADASAADNDDDDDGNNVNDDDDDDDTGGDVETDSDAGTGDDSATTVYPTVPSILSLSGCPAVGPLCSVLQSEGLLDANCGGLQYTGTISEGGEIALTAEPETAANGATITRDCTGKLSNRGQFRAECTLTTSAVGDEPEAIENCQLQSDPLVLPSVECMELPSELTGVSICSEGDDAGGQTLAAGTCHVVQDGCDFQAECDDGTTLTGAVSMSGISFRQTLVALADAETPTDGEPQFVAGDSVSHRCSAMIDGSSLIGECAAGRAGRGGANTSVCTVEGGVPQAAQCAPLSPAGEEQIFVLDSCDALKNGEGSDPGIGEPLCAFRQTNCIWEIQCGRGMKYTGRIEPEATSFEWKLETGTACRGSFSESGDFAGLCAVPDLFSCDLSSKAAAPGDAACPSAPLDKEVTSRGCGNGSGSSMDCRELEWNGCDFLAICSFASMESLVFAGTASEADGRGHLDLTGIGDWSCQVDAPTAAELQSDAFRGSNEWIGQCETAEGGLCRDTFDPQTGEGFRGLQLFWGEAEEPDGDADADAGAGVAGD